MSLNKCSSNPSAIAVPGLKVGRYLVRYVEQPMCREDLYPITMWRHTPLWRTYLLGPMHGNTWLSQVESISCTCHIHLAWPF